MTRPASSDGSQGGSHAFREAHGPSTPPNRRWIAPVAVVIVALAIAIAVLTWPQSERTPPATDSVTSGVSSGSADSATPVVAPDAASAKTTPKR